MHDSAGLVYSPTSLNIVVCLFYVSYVAKEILNARKEAISHASVVHRDSSGLASFHQLFSYQ